jgi:hypothetical protein
MLVRVNANTSSKSVPTEPTALVCENSLWHEFKYKSGAEVFGEAKPAEYVYRLREGCGSHLQNSFGWSSSDWRFPFAG